MDLQGLNSYNHYLFEAEWKNHKCKNCGLIFFTPGDAKTRNVTTAIIQNQPIVWDGEFDEFVYKFGDKTRFYGNKHKGNDYFSNFIISPANDNDVKKITEAEKENSYENVKFSLRMEPTSKFTRLLSENKVSLNSSFCPHCGSNKMYNFTLLDSECYGNPEGYNVSRIEKAAEEKNNEDAIGEVDSFISNNECNLDKNNNEINLSKVDLVKFLDELIAVNSTINFLHDRLLMLFEKRIVAEQEYNYFLVNAKDSIVDDLKKQKTMIIRSKVQNIFIFRLLFSLFRCIVSKS